MKTDVHRIHCLLHLNDPDIQAYRAEGHAAYLASLCEQSHIENPYHEFTVARIAWDMGWKEARLENK